MSTPVYLNGRQCTKCGWKQATIYFHELQYNRYACIRCGSAETEQARFRLDPTEVAFGNPTYDKHLDRYYIQVTDSNYFVTFKRNPNDMSSPIEGTLVDKPTLIYLVSGTSSDILVIAEGEDSSSLGISLLKFHHILTPILGRHTELKRELSASSMIRGIRGILHDGATIIRG